MIYKYEHKPIGRTKPGGGKKSAVASAAYRAGTKLTDNATGKIYDYTKKQGILYSKIIAPPGEIAPKRDKLWNMAEAAEKREDARIAREIIAALDPDLSLKQNIAICDRQAKKLALRYGCAVDYSIHAPPPGGDPRNLHVHYMLTTRRLENGKLTEKTELELSDTVLRKAGKPSGRAQIKELRKNWQDEVNAALKQAGKEYRIDARSYHDQGKNIMPGIHLGADATKAERRGERTEKGDYNRLVATINAAQAELDRREREDTDRRRATLAQKAKNPPPDPPPRTFVIGTRSPADLLGSGPSRATKDARAAEIEAKAKRQAAAEAEKERKNNQIKKQAIGLLGRQPKQETNLERRQREHRENMEKAGVYNKRQAQKENYNKQAGR